MPTRDEAFLREVRALRCFACGKNPPSEAHHIWTRGAGGGDDWYNCISLCMHCHTANKNAWHRGKLKFLETYPHVWEHLQSLGWERNGDKLFHPEMLNGSIKTEPSEGK